MKFLENKIHRNNKYSDVIKIIVGKDREFIQGFLLLIKNQLK